MNKSIQALSDMAQAFGLPPEVGDYLRRLAQCGCDDVCSDCCQNLATLDNVITQVRAAARPDYMDLVLRPVRLPAGFEALSGSPWACCTPGSGSAPNKRRVTIKPLAWAAVGFVSLAALAVPEVTFALCP